MNYWTKKASLFGLIDTRQAVFRLSLMAVLSLLYMTQAVASVPYFEQQIHESELETQEPETYEPKLEGILAKGQPSVPDILSAGEWFRYEVSYGFFTLGWVEVSILPDTVYNGRVHNHLLTRMISNDRLPLIGYELDEFHTLFYVNEEGLPVSSLFWKDNVDEEEWDEIVYRFDRDNEQVFYKEEDETTGELSLVEPATAGHIVFVYSRLFAGGGANTELPVYVSKQLGYLDFDHSSATEMRAYEVFEEPIATYKTNGRTVDIVGPFGFSGRFVAFFGQDDLRIPLEARVKMFLGSAVVKLIEYRKGNSGQAIRQGME
ncbi:MAG: DUF3108 domain-containing protein [Rhodothermaeota bacterium MED-G12]|nr:MAG: DUF3108 domain-containing protein [Rhodothermaeota bacterium MED-G12]CAI8320144.1 MAG: Uncharacterised protein [Rhodothermaeota bacterium MED-G12]